MTARSWAAGRPAGCCPASLRHQRWPDRGWDRECVRPETIVQTQAFLQIAAIDAPQPERRQRSGREYSSHLPLLLARDRSESPGEIYKSSECTVASFLLLLLTCGNLRIEGERIQLIQPG